MHVFQKSFSDRDVFGRRDLYICIRTFDDPDIISVMFGKCCIIRCLISFCRSFKIAFGQHTVLKALGSLNFIK